MKSTYSDTMWLYHIFCVVCVLFTYMFLRVYAFQRCEPLCISCSLRSTWSPTFCSCRSGAGSWWLHMKTASGWLSQPYSLWWLYTIWLEASIGWPHVKVEHIQTAVYSPAVSVGAGLRSSSGLYVHVCVSVRVCLSGAEQSQSISVNSMNEWFMSPDWSKPFLLHPDPLPSHPSQDGWADERW